MSYAYEMPKAFPGMIADMTRGHTETLPCGAVNGLQFGIVVGKVAGKANLPVGAAPAGITLHDQVEDHNGRGAYRQFSAVSLETRRPVWCRASGVCTEGAVAKYDPTTGIFSDAGSATLTGCTFGSKDSIEAGIMPNDPPFRIVLVKLQQAPFV